MRKAIVGVVLVLAMSGMALAVPAGVAGTFYAQSKCQGMVNQKDGYQVIWYFNVNSDWQTVDNDGNVVTTGACTYLDTINTLGDYTNPNVLFWADETTGSNTDMGGTYCNASLLLAYDATAAGTYVRYDVRRPDGTILNLNPGVYVSDVAGLPGTNGGGSTNAYQVVTSSFLPNGAADGALGIANNGYGTNRDGAVWCDTDSDGMYDNGTAVTAVKSVTVFDDYSAEFGMMAGRNSTGFNAVYKTETGYTLVSMTSDTCAHDYLAYSSGCGIRTPGDVDGDGLLDVYYGAYKSSPSIYHKFAHGEDQNDDGDWWDAGEVWDSGCGTSVANNVKAWDVMQVAPADELFPGGHWVLWTYRGTSATGAIFKVYGLDATGQFDGEVLTFLDPTVDSSLADMYTAGATYLRFIPLNSVSSEGDVPEPGTMLLVGTGILSLAGVVRRRLIG